MIRGLVERQVVAPGTRGHRLPAERRGGAEQRRRQGEAGEHLVQRDGPLGPTRQRDHTTESALPGEQNQSRNRDTQQSSMRRRRGDDHRSEQRDSHDRQQPVGKPQVQGRR